MSRKDPAAGNWCLCSNRTGQVSQKCRIVPERKTWREPPTSHGTTAGFPGAKTTG